MNKKALYESIMKSVAKEVKKAINEAFSDLKSDKYMQDLINADDDIVKEYDWRKSSWDPEDVKKSDAKSNSIRMHNDELEHKYEKTFECENSSKYWYSITYNFYTHNRDEYTYRKYYYNILLRVMCKDGISQLIKLKIDDNGNIISYPNRNSIDGECIASWITNDEKYYAIPNIYSKDAALYLAGIVKDAINDPNNVWCKPETYYHNYGSGDRPYFKYVYSYEDVQKAIK